MKMKRTFALLLGLILVCAGIYAGGGTQTSSAGAGKEVTLSLSSASFDLSPFGGDSGSRHTIRWQLYSRLFGPPDLGATLDQLQGEVAKSVTFPSPDTAVVQIYNYVKDSKGNAINANDVVWCYTYGKTQVDFNIVNANLKSIRAIDDYTVEIVATNTGAGVMQALLFSIPIVSQSWFQNASASERTGDPACTGPYHITSYVSGNQVVLEKLPNFWQNNVALRSNAQQQPLDKITYLVKTEAAQRVIALQNKEVDASQVGATDVYRFQKQDGSADPAWTVKAIDNGRFNNLMFNCDPKLNGPFTNQKLRQAVLTAIDFEAVRLGYGNTPTSGKTMHDFCSGAASDYNKKWDSEPYYNYDVAKAKQLMADAGFKPGQLKIRMMNQNSTTANAGMAVIQSMLAAIGIDAQILSYDQALFNTYKYDSTQWDIIVDSKFTMGFVVDAWALCFDARSFQNGTANFVHDDKLQSLLMDAMQKHDAASIDAFHYYLLDQAYGVGMFYNYQYWVAQSGITNIGTEGTRNVAINISTFAPDYKTVVQ